MIMPGSRVMVFDNLLFKNDTDTPISFTVRPATVVCRYGRKTSLFEGHLTVPTGGYFTSCYPDLVDVVFDHRPNEVSKGHFTEGVKEI